MTPAELRRDCELDAEAGGRWRRGTAELGLSARGWDRCLRLARTIADLGGRGAHHDRARRARRSTGVSGRGRERQRAAAGLRRVPAARLAGRLARRPHRQGGRATRRAAGRASSSRSRTRTWLEAMARSRRERFLERAAARETPLRMRAAVDRRGRLGVLPPRRRLSGGARASSATRPPCSSAGAIRALLAELGADDAVTIVGSRRPSRYGRELAAELGRELAAAGMAVVSGMAMGIDSCRARGSARGRGLTVAVLGSGVDVPIRRATRGSTRRSSSVALVIGELPPGTRAAPLDLSRAQPDHGRARRR